MADTEKKKDGVMSMIRIAVSGTGYVGLSAGLCFAEVGHQVVCVDIDENKIGLLKQGISPFYEDKIEEIMKKNSDKGRIAYTSDYSEAYKHADAIFIAVGTPAQPDGSADLTNIFMAARQIAENIEQDCIVVVKSTVPVGTNDKVEQYIKGFLKEDVKVEIVSNPEFLSQGSSIYNTLHAERIIIGTESKRAEEIIRKIYEPFDLPVLSVRRKSAEMIKYASNVFLALKISYINDIANLCELVGADIKEVSKGMSFDERIGSKFLNAGIGYGGSCLPKDSKALDSLAKQNGYEMRTVMAAIDVNEKQKTALFNKALKRPVSLNAVKTAVLGLTFKPGTDDSREAPSLENVSLLLEQGADITAYDPVGRKNFAQRFPEGKHGKGSIRYARSAREALEGASLCFVFTEWDEIKSLNAKDYKKLMKTPLVYDGRNIYDVEEMKKAGVEYYSVGR